jgi:glucan 1,3-beta-glucosidase
MLGVVRVALAVLAVQAALGLVFDPRYRDFLFAPLTAATVPLLLLAPRGQPATKEKLLGRWKRRPQAPAAETAVAATLAVSAIYIVANESFANWQAVWFAAALLALAFTLLQVKDAPG